MLAAPEKVARPPRKCGLMTAQHSHQNAAPFIREDVNVIHVSLSLVGEIPPHLRPILRALMLGVIDTTACRELNISSRTFSRRVAELLEHLGAESRFQAGMLVILSQVEHGTAPLRSALS